MSGSIALLDHTLYSAADGSAMCGRMYSRVLSCMLALDRPQQHGGLPRPPDGPALPHPGERGQYRQFRSIAQANFLQFFAPIRP